MAKNCFFTKTLPPPLFYNPDMMDLQRYQWIHENRKQCAHLHRECGSTTKYKKGKKLAMVLAKTQTYLTQHHYHAAALRCIVNAVFCSQLGALVCNGFAWVQNLQGNFNRDFIAGYTLVAIVLKHCFLFYSQMILIMGFS